MSTPRTPNQPRSRIVVQLEQPQTGAPPGRGFMRGGSSGGGANRGSGSSSGLKKVLGLLALALVAVVLAATLGGYLWWRNYKQSPGYTLALLVDASLRDDTKAFDEIVDTDKVTENFAPQVADKITGNSGAGGAMLDQLRNRLGANTQQILATARESVREEIKRQTKELGARGANVPFPLLALAVPRAVDEIKEEGDTATVSLKINNSPMQLTMQRNGERWRVTGIRDERLATQIAERVQKDYPSLTNNNNEGNSGGSGNNRQQRRDRRQQQQSQQQNQSSQQRNQQTNKRSNTNLTDVLPNIFGNRNNQEE